MTVKSPPQKGPRRLVACKKHRLHYDPSLQSGCVLCRKENPLGEVKAQRPILGWLAILVVAAGVAAWFGYRARGGPAASTTSTETVAVDPASYQTQITILENALYQPGPGTASTATRAGNAASVLATSLRQREKSYAAETGAQRLDAFRADLTASVPPFELGGLRGQWEAIREEVFADAAWFRRAPVASEAPVREDPAAARVGEELRAFADRVSALLASANGELVAFDGTDPDRASRFEQWAARWTARVTELRQLQPPPPPPTADPGHGLAHAKLESAVAALAELGQSAFAGDVPDAARRQAISSRVEAAVSEARTYLAQAGSASG